MLYSLPNVLKNLVQPVVTLKKSSDEIKNKSSSKQLTTFQDAK